MPSSNGPLASLALLAVALAATPSAAAAQGGTCGTAPPIVGGAPFVEAWVDPCNGNDGLAAVGCPTSPFRTLNAAILAVAASGVGPANPGLVHANPGVYGPLVVGGNGETLPVIMRDYVNVQGVGAKRTIIRGDQTQTVFNLFTPLGGAGCTCGQRQLLEALVDLTFLTLTDYEEMIDAFTLQGGHVQVYAETEVNSIRARISNCVFDMLHLSDVGVPGPLFGILMVHVWDLPFPGGYRDIPLNILNNTFIQGWTPLPGLTVTAVPNNVAICDVNDPLCGFAFPDPNPTLRGPGNPNIQNNLIRCWGGARRTALLGIDSSDVTAAVATVPGPSNAFDPALVGGFDLTGTWCSQILGAAPPAAVNPNPFSGGIDPAFIGEMLSSFGAAISLSRDWRLLPDSILVDAGTAPIGGQLAAANGTRYVVPPNLPEWSHDFDGEVYGNPRNLGQSIDIGFDETDVMVNCAAYGNDTRTYGVSCGFDCSNVPGALGRALVFPAAGAYSLFETRAPMPFPVAALTCPGLCPPGFWFAWTVQFNNAVPPVAAGGFPPGNNLIWLGAGAVQTVFNAPIAAFAGYVPPGDVVPHAFGFAFPPPATDTCVYLNEQAIYTPAGGPAPLLSNLQQSFD